MKYIQLSMLLLVSVINPVSAKKPHEPVPTVYLSYCSNFGTGVNYSFQSCVNSNFSSVQREVGGFYGYCMNIGNEVDYSFTSCVNSGFREAQRQLGNNIWLQDCYNFNRDTLDFSFVSCVNSNFSRISSELSNKAKDSIL